MKTLRLLALGAALSTVLFAATSASAATTIGSKCAANTGAPITLFTTTTSSGESYVVPSNGVLTEWGTNHTSVGNDQVVSAVLGGPTGPNWLIAANAPSAFVGANTSPAFAVRIPVTAGQTLGSATSTAIGTPSMCSTSNPADTGVYAGPVGIGVPFSTTNITSNKASIWATIEPDVDGDGYGDDTQDKCPQSAAWQNPCPELKIATQLSATSTEIRILASTTVDTSLTATATITIASKTKATFKSKATPFVAARFKTIKLKLPSSVKKALKSKKLKATVTVTGSGLSNTATSTSKITLKRR